jgi:hypothetical protein
MVQFGLVGAQAPVCIRVSLITYFYYAVSQVSTTERKAIDTDGHIEGKARMRGGGPQESNAGSGKTVSIADGWIWHLGTIGNVSAKEISDWEEEGAIAFICFILCSLHGTQVIGSTGSAPRPRWNVGGNSGRSNSSSSSAASVASAPWLTPGPPSLRSNNHGHRKPMPRIQHRCTLAFVPRLKLR